MSQSTAWVALLGVVIGGALTFATTEYRECRERNRKRHGNFEALAVEIQICGELADGYLKGNVLAPAYRMPMIAYQRSFPELLTDGVLAVDETKALIRFYINVAAFNFSVDQAQAALMSSDEERPPHLIRETKRARLKAAKLRRGEPQYSAALDVAKAHLPKESRERLAIPIEALAEEERD